MRNSGWDVHFECSQHQAPVRLDPDSAQWADVVFHADCVERYAGGIVSAARRAATPVALVMDGLLEFANTFLNHEGGTSFLRPPPADLVITAGLHDAAIFGALGVHAVPLGLPRFSGQPQSRSHDQKPSYDLLVATANTAAHTASAYLRSIETLRALHALVKQHDLKVRWRVQEHIAGVLGVERDTDTLKSSLEDVRAVCTFASTLCAESMLAGKPTALLHPHPWPLWQPAVWVYRPQTGIGWSSDADFSQCNAEEAHPATYAAEHSLTDGLAGVAQYCVDDLEALIRAILSPTANQMNAQSRLAQNLCAYPHPESFLECAKDLIEKTAHADGTESQSKPSLRGQRARDRPIRVLSLIAEHASTVGGVQVWSDRMAQQFKKSSDVQIEWSTLRIRNGIDGFCLDACDGDQIGICTLDPTKSNLHQMTGLAESINAMSPDVVLPNYGELQAAAADLWRRGGRLRRVLAIAHTNDHATKRLWGTFSNWDAAVGVSESCVEWLQSLAMQRPVHQIVYGVPLHSTREQCVKQTIQIAYIGRVVEQQKRVSDLIPFLEELESSGVRYEFHMVGDGDALEAWIARLSDSSVPIDRVKLHGSRSPVWVQEFLKTIDVMVQCSDAEGTSITLLESMAAGVLPCVTRTDSGVQQLIQNGVHGVLGEIGDPRSMAAALVRSLDDPAAVLAMQQASQGRIQRCDLSIETCAALYEQAIVQVFTDEQAEVSFRDPLTSLPPRTGHAVALTDESSVQRYAHIADPINTLTHSIIAPTAAHPGRAALNHLRRSGIAVVCPSVDDDHAVHITDQVSAFIDSHQSIYIALGPSRMLAQYEWLALHKRSSIRAFVRLGAQERESLYGVPVVDFDSVERAQGCILLVPSLGIDAQTLLATCNCERLGIEVEAIPDDRQLLEAARGVLQKAHALPEDAVVMSDLNLPVDRERVGVDLNTKADPSLVVLGNSTADFARFQDFSTLRARGVEVVSVGIAERLLEGPTRLMNLVAGSLHGAMYALYGGGMHTHHLLEHASLCTAPACIFDDGATQSDSILGIPIQLVTDPWPDGIEAVVLSSYRWEDALWERAALFRERGITVHRLYQ